MISINSKKTGKYLILCGLLLVFIIFIPFIYQELKYFTTRPNNDMSVVIDSNKTSVTKHFITPVDKDFSVVIPKIGVNSKVIPNVDYKNSFEYQEKLKYGIAHAKNTVFPGQIGNSFLFAHSSVDFYNAIKYNSVFYLLYKLNKNDKIYAVYKNEIYKYTVSDVKIVNEKDMQYLINNTSTKTLTLMTCWPLGTNYKRLVVIATL
ncbi:hypothetical protein COV24_02670 [candidate division WWE3 bacterium CG10_big_fil_rev_8_21_14_0_10_32_10]|uniref:Sortase n=1 Tax=candidate division WWE3 bacterium CG10_big_fil_rev_8_21_14_0_10_32_10 TaxID=1975090 RepID=A0A2H0RAD7_UNCKA|nr:MAG: hypothetical protein COV24_02670 [candidate division WWE3 bacterium CG10_big_fil_rev_8_21_14_0_10_32_10]